MTHLAYGPVLLVLIILLPLFIWLDMNLFKQYLDKRKVFADSGFLNNYWPLFKQRKWIGPQLIWLMAIVLVVVAIARPQGNPRVIKKKMPERLGYIVLDASQSMKVQDSEGQRFEQAKAIAQHIRELEPQDRLGLILFEKEAQQLCPATVDRDAFKLALTSARPGNLSDPGSEIGSALMLAIEKCQAHANQQKYIILISDGEQHGPVDLEAIAAAAKQANVMVIAIGVGTRNGGLIPQGKDFWGKLLYKTYYGKRVVSKLNPDHLITIARLTQGRYFYWQQPLLFKKIHQGLNQVNQVEKQQQVIVYQEYAFGFILIALVLLFVEPFCKRSVNIRAK